MLTFFLIQIGQPNIKKMTNPNDKIRELRIKLDKLGVKTDRDLVKQLGIKSEDKKKLYAWIEFQGTFEFANGYKIGQNELKDAFKKLMEIEE